VLFLTAGVDVQIDRLVYEVVGWGRGKESWSIEIGVIPGDTAKPDPWNALGAALISRTFTHANGAELAITKLAVDSGFNTQTVYNWVRNHKPRAVATKGTDRAGILVGTVESRRRARREAHRHEATLADRHTGREE
jgi:phage terminase large subunit GpA-like protein